MLRLCKAASPRADNEAALRAYLCESYWLPADDFPMCGDIFHALGMTGDDCQEFMNGIAETFNVDLADFIWPKYHLGEAEAMDVRAALRPLRRFVGLKTKPLDRDLIPISIDHLLHVIQLGEWADPEPGQQDDGPSIGQSISRMRSRLRAGGVPRRQSR